ncbi:MutS protein msh5 [Ascosphaera aggregata]|nr:MutS protein msh5 [Ascosphaera aggregata]
MFLRPSTDMELLRQRHDFISTFLRPENTLHLDKINKSMRGVKNLKPVLIQLRKGIAHGSKFTGFKSGLWVTLMEFAYHTIDIQETLKLITGGEHLNLLNKVS